MDLEKYKAGLGERLNKAKQDRKEKKVQATYKQQLAVETAEKLNDLESLGIYLRLFKRYNHIPLIECREWVLRKGTGNLGRLFVASYKKFLNTTREDG